MRARRASDPSRLVEVELDDGALDDAPQDGPAGSGARADDGSTPGEGQARDGAPGARGARRLRSAGLAAVVVAALLVVAANLVEVRRDREREARLAGLPGVVDSLAEPLAERWRTPGWLGADLGPLLLVESPGGIGAIDPATGASAWTLDEEDVVRSGAAYCRPPTPERGVLVREVPDVDVLLCLPAFGEDGPRAPTVEALLVDARTGVTRDVLTTEGDVVGVEWVAGAVVLLLAAPDGALRAAAWDRATGERRWETTTSPDVFRPGGGPEDILDWQQRGDVVVITGGEGRAAVDLGTGAQVPPDAVEREPAPEDVLTLPDGGSVRMPWGADDRPGRVVDADGTTRFTLTAYPLVAWVDDGAVPDVLVVTDDERLRGLDARTGEERWSAAFTGAQALVSVDGTLVLAHGLRTVALDVRTGTVLWEVDRGGSGGYPTALTDGELVVVAETSPLGDGPSSLVARSLRDGREVWRAPVAGDAWGVTSTRDGHVVVSTEDAVVGLG